jgi:hypothetical protein
MTDEQLRELYGLALQRPGFTPPDTCVPEHQLLEVATGDPTVDRVAVLEHIAQCPECRAELDLFRTVTSQWPAPQRPVQRRRLVLLGLLGALGAALLLLNAVLSGAFGG